MAFGEQIRNLVKRSQRKNANFVSGSWGKKRNFRELITEGNRKFQQSAENKMQISPISRENNSEFRQTTAENFVKSRAYRQKIAKTNSELRQSVPKNISNSYKRTQGKKSISSISVKRIANF